jgi:transposase-like protein
MASSENGLVRPRRTPAQRQRLLARYHRSKLTLKRFTARHGIGLSTLSAWLWSERNTIPAKVKFQEVRLRNPPPRWPVEVVSPQGWTVRLQNGSDVQMLRQLLQALPC